MRTLACLVALSLSPAIVFAGDLAGSTSRAGDDVAFLADPALRGRETGSPEAELAARYVRHRLQDAGLAPPAGADDFFQPVPLVRVAFDAAKSALTWRTGTTTGSAAIGTDAFVELAGRPDATGVDLALVDVGWGATAPDRRHDDYAGLDVRGKAVLVRAGEPKDALGKPLLGEGHMTRYALASTKLANAAAHGARLVLIASAPTGPPLAQALASKQRDLARPKLALRDAPASPVVVYVGADVAARLASAKNTTLRLDLAALRADDVTDRNVLAWLPGTDPALANAPIVVGAHYDHLGYDVGRDGALTVYPGADDNASGVAGLVAVADALARGPRLPRPVLFAAFTGEEENLLGSRWLASHPLPQGSRPAAMINLDQLGRNAADKPANANVVMASFAAKCPLLMPLLTELAAPHALDVRRLGHVRPVGRSDDAPFEEQKIPTVFFFTGAHKDYHAPGDRAELVDPGKITRIAGLVADLVSRLATHAGPLPWDDALTQPPPQDPWDRPY